MSCSDKNLIIIMADQMRYDVLGPHTPNINALFSDSISIENTYCASPLCVPARGAFYTGKYPNENGSLINPWEQLEFEHGCVNTGITNLYELMQEHWSCHHSGKQHLYTIPKPENNPETKVNWHTLEKEYGPFLASQNQKAPGGPRFRSPVPEMAYGTTTRRRMYSSPATGCYPGELDHFFDGFILNQSIQTISERDTDKPFMLSANFLAPHPPFEVPEPWYSMIDSDQVKLPENVGIWADNQSPLQLYNLTGMIGTRYSREDWHKTWRVYLGLVALLDHCVGQLISRLKEEGLYDNSIIIFTADHGEMLGSHQLWQKMCHYQEAVKVPFCVKMPGQELAGKEIKGNASHIDIMPTLCELLEIPYHGEFSGISLVSAFQSGEIPERDIYIQFDGNGARGNFSRAVVRNNHKLIVDIFKDEIFFELYDLENDPQEMNNLVFTQYDQAESLLKSLIDFMDRTQDAQQIDLSDLLSSIKRYSPWNNAC